MTTIRISAELQDDRRLTVTLPAEVPLGKIDLLITVEAQNGTQVKPPRSSLADWAERNAEDECDAIKSDDVKSLTGRSL